MCQMILPASSSVSSSSWRSSSSINAKHEEATPGYKASWHNLYVWKGTSMTTVSPKPDTKTLAGSAARVLRFKQWQARLPHLSDLLRQQGALIALIIVVIFSFIRYD